ncbi:MAG TPA: hypothetical protein VKA46_01395 [Gemmataceae bacterium]|nr:hypothetical protein [Gemmataceae bacterium]
MSDEPAPPRRMAPNLTRLAFFYLVPTSLSLLVVAAVYAFYFAELWIGLILFASAYFGLSLSHWVVKLAGQLGTAYSGRTGLVSQEAGVCMKALTRLVLILIIPAVTLLFYHGVPWYLAFPLGLVAGFVVAAGVGMGFAYISWDERERAAED